ncbi:MAG: hypothetical protein QW100_04430, partial [Thermoplasmatales archaeon]
MFKPNNKKMLTVLIAVAMVFSAFVVLSIASEPAFAAASGTVTYSPTTYGIESGTAVQTVAFTSGGTFSSGATVYFYLSSTDSASGLLFGGYAIGGTILGNSSPTSLSQAVEFFPHGHTIKAVLGGGLGNDLLGPATNITPGVYYILASQVTPPTNPAGLSTGAYAFPAAGSQFVPQTASLVIINPVTLQPATVEYSSPLTVGSTGIAKGTGFDAGASISIYLGYPGGTSLGTGTVNSVGSFEISFTVPQLAGTAEVNQYNSSYKPITSPYTVVAQETSAYSPSAFPQGGITADSQMDVAPSLTVTPIDISGTAGTTLTLTGTGFPAAGVMAGSSSTSPSTSIEITTLEGGTTSYSLYYPSVTVSSTGQFTVTATLASAITITGTGPYGILTTLTDKAPYITPISNLFTPALFVSIPNAQALGLFFEPTPVIGTTYNPIISPIAAAVYNFPASEFVSIYIGATLVGNVTTDANGYAALPSSAVIPAMPAGSYVVSAVSSTGLVAVPTTGIPSGVGTPSHPLKVSPFFWAMDNVTNLLLAGITNEYVPQSGTIVVQAFGLSPNIAYYATDSWLFDVGISPNVVYEGLVTGISVGTENLAQNAIYPAANGTLIFTYSPFYGYYSQRTGFPDTIGFGYGNPTGLTGPFASIPSYANLTIGYYQIGAPTVSVLQQTLHPGETGVSVTVRNLITIPTPYSFYPGTSGFYNIYIGTTKITTSSPPGLTILNGTQLSSVRFTVPSLASGVYNISVTYAGQPVSSALSPLNTTEALVVVSTPGTTISAGSLVTVPVYYKGLFNGYAVAAYGLDANVSAELLVYNSLGPYLVPSTTTGTYGEIFNSGVLSSSSSVYSSSSAGTFRVVLSLGTAPSASELYASYTVEASIFLSSQKGLYSPYPSEYYDYIGDVVTIYPTGLTAGTYYNIFFNNTLLMTVLYTPGGVPSPFSPSAFVVPVVASGQYYLNITQAGSKSVLVSQPFYVLPIPGVLSSYPNLTLWSAPGALTQQAFPGQIVYFQWHPSQSPYVPTAQATYPVTFYETGLHPGTSWSVTLNGITGSSTTPTITFTEPNGVYSFSVQASGYVPSIESGSLTVNGAPVNESIIFTPVFVLPTVTFTETGLTPGTTWYVALNGVTEYSSTSSISFSGIMPGTYSYVVEPVSGAIPTPASGSVSVSTSPITVPITFTAGTTYSVAFTETGLASTTSWSVTLNGITGSSTTPTITFYETAGTYSYSVMPIAGYSVSATLASPIAIRANTTVTVKFTEVHTFSVVFIETGLATGTSWNVTLNGVTLSATVAPRSTTITFSEPNGNYSFFVANVSGYTASLSSGTITVNGATVTVSITFTSTSNLTVTFTESGLTSVTTWYVALNGQTEFTTTSAATSSISFRITAGTYSYVVEPVNGFIPTPASGSVSVSTSPITVPITFTAGTTYSVAFNETGLASTTSWSVTLNGIRESATVSAGYSIITFYETPGTYSFSVMPISGYAVSLSSGRVSVSTADVAINVTFSGVRIYEVTFTESGLPAGTSWSVTLNGVTLSSSRNSIVFSEPNGTYSYTIGSISGYTATPSSGSITVNGAPFSESIAFTPVPTVTTYSVTFTESGLASGTSWSVTFNGSTASSTSSTITFTDVQNGLYFFNVSSAGYAASPSSGYVYVNGANLAIAITFSPMIAPTSVGTVYVTVYLNGTAYTTFPATVGVVAGHVYLNGSFLAPNAPPGSYWGVSLGWSQTTYASSSSLSGSVINTVPMPKAYTGKTVAYLRLVSGTGDLIVGISSSQIATIITNAVNSAMSVPISELSANITALHGDIATITTSFGTMTTTLQAINATVSAIESGQAIIKTDLGSMQTTLASLNASLVAFNKNVVSINTTLGLVTTSLAGINATVKSTATGVSSLEGSAVT